MAREHAGESGAQLPHVAGAVGAAREVHIQVGRLLAKGEVRTAVCGARWPIGGAAVGLAGTRARRQAGMGGSGGSCGWCRCEERTEAQREDVGFGLKDGGSAVALVHVEVDNKDAPRDRSARPRSRNRKVVQDGEAAAKVAVRVMGAARLAARPCCRASSTVFIVPMPRGAYAG